MNNGGPRMRLVNKSLKYAYFFKSVFYSKINFVIIRSKLLEIYFLTSRLIEVAKFINLNSICSFKSLADITVTDLVNYKRRFKLSYNVYSNTQALRLILQIFVEEKNFVSSIVSVFRSAG
jgi:NADH:ubiquinone oxidoreductase subunit C